MKIVGNSITIQELKEMALNSFGDFVKAVVDTERGSIALDAELHSDLEEMLLNDGSNQSELWGINLYPENAGREDFIEYDSLINIRPLQNNKSRYVEDDEIRKKISEIALKKVIL
jgi:hypothetical protein